MIQRKRVGYHAKLIQNVGWCTHAEIIYGNQWLTLFS